MSEGPGREASNKGADLVTVDSYRVAEFFKSISHDDYVDVDVRPQTIGGAMLVHFGESFCAPDDFLFLRQLLTTLMLAYTPALNVELQSKPSGRA